MRRLSGVLAAALIVSACVLAHAESPIKDPDSFWIEKQDEGSSVADVPSGGAGGNQVAGPAAVSQKEAVRTVSSSKDVMDKLRALKKKGLPDGKDETVFSPSASSAGSGGKGANVPRGKLPAVASEKKSDQIARAKTLLDLLSKHGRGGEANEGVSADSIDRAKRQVDRATGAAVSGPKSKDEQIADGVAKLKLLMKKGAGGVANEGWSGDSIKRVERQFERGGNADRPAVEKTQIRERALPYIQRSISNPADADRPCIGSGCRR
jgi:hypothetical protein